MILFIFRDRRREGERHPCMVASWACPQLGTWRITLACALDWESNWWPFGSQTALNPPSHASQGCYLFFLNNIQNWYTGLFFCFFVFFLQMVIITCYDIICFCSAYYITSISLCYKVFIYSIYIDCLLVHLFNQSPTTRHVGYLGCFRILLLHVTVW